MLLGLRRARAVSPSFCPNARLLVYRGVGLRLANRFQEGEAICLAYRGYLMASAEDAVLQRHQRKGFF